MDTSFSIIGCIGDEELAPLDQTTAFDVNSISDESCTSVASTVKYPDPDGDKFKDEFWSQNFSIPWNKVPSRVIRKCEEGKTISWSERRHVIQVIASEILTSAEKPLCLRFNTRRVATKVIAKYPGTFRDEIGGEVVDTGFESLAMELENKVYMDLRKMKERDGSQEPKHKKRKNDDSDVPVVASTSANSDSTEEEMDEKVVWMKRHHAENEWDLSKVGVYMRDTYKSQRTLIDNAKPIKEIMENFPFLFEREFLIAHFLQHTDHKFEAAMSGSHVIQQKSPKILKYMKEAKRKGYSKLDLEKPCALIIALANYFKEDAGCLVKVSSQMTIST